MFHDVLFKPRRPLQPTVTTSFSVEMVQLSSGVERRNARIASPRRSYRLPVGQRPLDELDAIMLFFTARGGPLHAFRFRDPFLADTAAAGDTVTSNDVTLGTGDGERTDFQLLRRDGAPVTKPDVESVRVAVNGQEVSRDEHYTVDPLSGIVSFSTAPAIDEIVTAGARFDVAVRFQNETLTMNQTYAGAGEIDDLLLLEVFE